MLSNWLSHILWWEWNGYSHLEKACQFFMKLNIYQMTLQSLLSRHFPIEIKKFLLQILEYKFYLHLYLLEATHHQMEKRKMHAYINRRNKLITHKALMNH